MIMPYRKTAYYKLYVISMGLYGTPERVIYRKLNTIKAVYSVYFHNSRALMNLVLTSVLIFNRS